MTPADSIEFARSSILVLLEIITPAMLTALVVGLGIGLLQALTQIQEMTLVFVPKIVAIFVVLLIALPFAGAAMNWDRTPGLRKLLHDAAARLTMPVFFIQAENDYSIRPTRELAASLEGTGKLVQSKIYPAFGVNNHEGHLLESRGPTVWAADVKRFLERHL